MTFHPAGGMIVSHLGRKKTRRGNESKKNQKNQPFYREIESVKRREEQEVKVGSDEDSTPADLNSDDCRCCCDVTACDCY